MHCLKIHKKINKKYIYKKEAMYGPFKKHISVFSYAKNICTVERGPFLGKWCFSSPFRHNWTYRINLGTQKISVQLKGDQTLLVAAWVFSKPFWFMISDLKTYKNQSTRNMYIRSRVRVLSRSISFTQVCLCLAIDKKKANLYNWKGTIFRLWYFSMPFLWPTLNNDTIWNTIKNYLYSWKGAKHCK